MLDCLIPLIGLSQRNCTCSSWTTGRPANYNESVSGFFIDDNINLLHSLYSDCGDGNIWDILESARRKAILRFELDVTTGISKASGQKKGSFSGDIGEATSNGLNTNVTNTIVGWKINGRGIKGSTFKIRSLKIGVNAAITTNVRVLKNGVSVYSVTANLLSATFTTVPFVYDMDLSEDDIFHVVYDLPANVYPLNNSITCNCPGRIYEWKSTIALAVVSAAMDNDFTCGNHNTVTGGAGIVMNVYTGCNPIYFICDFDKLEGYNYKLTIAKAIQLLAEIEVINHILQQNGINFYTLVSRESLYSIRNHAEKVYAEEYLNWLSSQFSLLNLCYECSTTNHIKKSAILI